MCVAGGGLPAVFERAHCACACLIAVWHLRGVAGVRLSAFGPVCALHTSVCTLHTSVCALHTSRLARPCPNPQLASASFGEVMLQAIGKVAAARGRRPRARARPCGSRRGAPGPPLARGALLLRPALRGNRARAPPAARRPGSRHKSPATPLRAPPLTNPTGLPTPPPPKALCTPTRPPPSWAPATPSRWRRPSCGARGRAYAASCRCARAAGGRGGRGSGRLGARGRAMGLPRGHV